MKCKLIILLICAITLFAHSEEKKYIRCMCEYSDHHDPEARKRRLAEDKEFLAYMRSGERQSIRQPGKLLAEIPVIVHVLYNNSTSNVSDEKIKDQIRILNEDYNMQNADASKTIAEFKSVQASAGIKFTLKEVKRISTTKKGFEYPDEVKFKDKGGSDPVDVKNNLNLWVVPAILYQGQDVGLIGNGQFPDDPKGDRTDGVVIKYDAFGSIGPVIDLFNKGRTATHEIGHWLGLRHTWGMQEDGCNQNDDDLVDDTPMQEKQTTSSPSDCMLSKSSCGSTDMVQNFMDYSIDRCMSLFTKGQVARMEEMIKKYRPNLLSSSITNKKPIVKQQTITQALTENKIFDIKGRQISASKIVNGVPKLTPGIYFIERIVNGKSKLVSFQVQ